MTSKFMETIKLPLPKEEDALPWTIDNKVYKTDKQKL